MTVPVIRTEQRYWKKFFNGYCKFLYNEKGHSDNFAASTFKPIKAFFNFLKTEKALSIGDFHLIFRGPQQQPLPIVLLPEQLQFLINNKSFEQQLPRHLQRTKDLLCSVAVLA